MSNFVNTIEQYINDVVEQHKTGHAREHAYRPAVENLMKTLYENTTVVNDPKQSEFGAPDFALLRKDTILGYIEAKDVNADLDKVEKSEQMKRYLGYRNLILTNYVEFRFYQNGEVYNEPIIIAKLANDTIIPNTENFSVLADTLSEFFTHTPEPIKSGAHLAKVMGGKARRIRDNVNHFLANESKTNVELVRVYDIIKKLLVHDLTLEAFADMYAQTLVYGLFVARFHDETPKTFSRQEARDLIPVSNPLLQHFFDHIVGPNFDKRLEYIVNELCEVFSHADVQELMSQYFKKDLWGKTHADPDPVIHFYEDFLKEYDSELRKKLGAFYTPLPVVQFIVRAVDHILEKEFNLPQGLADTTKTSNDIHKVQILDPAVGTGTFISATIRSIYERLIKDGQKGRWTTYVHNDLLPRLHGFELMMAPYTIAHLKLSMAFKKTGFKYFNDRLGIYLTNSLEESPIQNDMFTAFGFAESIAEESKEASIIKNETPVMVVLGNPPYSVSSSNKGEWIQDLIKDYKKDLGERKINLDDDYIKFIRFSEHFIEKNKSGIVAMITNNSFIDGITHRQMRKHLLETFDDIYILDLHGNSKKKEKALDGGKDENVFDIQQGVSISIFVRKTKEKKTLGKVHHAELYGKRKDKFKMLDESDMQNIKWQKLDYSDPYYFFAPKDTESESEYKKGFKIDELMSEYNSGIQTKNDELSMKLNEEELDTILNDFDMLSLDELRTKYNLKDTSGWGAERAKQSLKEGFQKTKILYRPFDLRNSILSEKSGGFVGRPRYKTSKHFLNNNLGLITVRQQSTFDFQHILATKFMIESGAISLQTKEWGYIFPLYLYPEKEELPRVDQIPISRKPNLNLTIARDIADATGSVYYPFAEYPTKDSDVRLTPEDIFDYIYAVLHSPNYREKYKEFLKIDFPRVPYPKDKKQFEALVAFGKELRELHLLESPKVSKLITTYSVAGSDVVEKISYKDKKVFINEDQYFGNIPEIAWNFYIGGYQPAQKWLKDRKGRTLTNTDIEHYQKIIVVLVETDRIMKEIDKI